jgi:hypothetical protein
MAPTWQPGTRHRGFRHLRRSRPSCAKLLIGGTTDVANHIQQKVCVLAAQAVIDTAGTKRASSANPRRGNKHASIRFQCVGESLVQRIEVRLVSMDGRVSRAIPEAHDG